MASLRRASPRLRNYFKQNYIPQVCEVLLCGLLVTCPQDPLRYLEEMIITIMKNGLESLLWDMCIDPAMKPRIRRLSETYLEQLFGLDDQLMTPELMIKACTFYTGHLVKTHFCTWKDLTIPRTNEDDGLAEKKERAMKYNNFRLQKHVFHHWYSYVKARKEQLKDILLRIQQIFHFNKLINILTKWRDKARHKYQEREDELLLKHELQLNKWRNKIKYQRGGEEQVIPPEQSLSEDSFIGEIPECDISLLPEKAVLQIFFYLSLRDVVTCGQVCHSWMSMIQIGSLWNRIDFSTVKNMITDKYIVSTLQRWRLNVLRLNFRGCLLRLKTMRSISLCKNLQELNVSDCPTLTDESMRYISEGCSGVLYLNLSNTTITNRTMRLLPRHFHNLQNLSLAYCKKFTDKGLRYLNLGNGCHKLIYLDLSGCTQISVQGFRNIADSCTGIMHLTINDMPTLTDNCVKALVEKCARITSAVFIGAPHISDCAFKALSTCNLKKIRFEGNKRITDACFKSIGKHYPNISHIYMVDCKRITDGSLKSLSPLKRLRVLNLANCVRIGDTGLKYFLDGPVRTRIRELNLTNCIQLGDASIVKLPECCPNLNYLSLRNCEYVTDIGIESIINIFSLVSVDLSGTSISNEEILWWHKPPLNLQQAGGKQSQEKLASAIQHKAVSSGDLASSSLLRFVAAHLQSGVYLQQGFIITCLAYEHDDVSCSLSGARNFCIHFGLKDVGLMILSRHKKLKELSLSECNKITDIGIQAFCKGSLILEHLDVSYCPQLSDEFIIAVAIYCINITSLNIAGCPKITDSAMEVLSAKCHYLHILDTSGCVLLTDQMLENLQIGCKQLRILKMQYCRHISKEAAEKMSSTVQQQEYSPSDPPLWFGYDCEGKPLREQQDTAPPTDTESTVKESTYNSEEEIV